MWASRHAVAAALDHAHRHGVLHRDVKPANILLAASDPGQPERVLLADFGIARLRDDAQRLTQTGSFTAALAFAAPEQLAGPAVDHRCDQYSLACTLFALLCRQSPFVATNPAAVIEAQMKQPPPPITSRRPDLPPALDAVLSRALAKRPDDRYASCGEFACAAAKALRSAVAPTVAAGTSQFRRLLYRIPSGRQIQSPRYDIRNIPCLSTGRHRVPERAGPACGLRLPPSSRARLRRQSALLS
ncbi:protein kinase domain-containing protein [Nocardia africana]